jgi:hypothetical protein
MIRLARRFAALAAAVALVRVPLWACPNCYGAGDNTPVVTGMMYAVLGMLLVTGIMLGLIVAGAIVYRKRANALAAGFPADASSAQSTLTI